MNVSIRRRAQGLTQHSPRRVQRAVQKWLTALHVSSAAVTAAANSAARKAVRARAQDWGFFTLYLPGIEHPLYARPRTSDLAAFYAIFGRSQQAVDLGFEPRFIVDLGANVGYASVDLALRHPRASIVAVEPEPSNVAVLRHNIKGLRIEVVEAAVWPRPALLQLEEAEIGHVGFRVQEVASSRGGVRAVTVPELMARFEAETIDLLKIDIEGSELELLSEQTDWLTRVRAISIEFHDAFRPGCRATGEAALARAGFDLRETVSGAHYYLRSLSPSAASPPT